MRWSLAVPCLIGVVLLAACSGKTSSPDTSAEFSMDEPVKLELNALLGFRCLWWSEEQMRGLNPSAPPAKTTEISLDHWEYTDPVGVPHPDEVDLLADVRNAGPSPATNLTIELFGQWRMGLEESPSSAVWGELFSLSRQTGVTVGVGQTEGVRVPVNLAAKMKELELRKQWPFALRVVMLVQSAESTELIRREIEFPIQARD